MYKYKDSDAKYKYTDAHANANIELLPFAVVGTTRPKTEAGRASHVRTQIQDNNANYKYKDNDAKYKYTDALRNANIEQLPFTVVGFTPWVSHARTLLWFNLSLIQCVLT